MNTRGNVQPQGTLNLEKKKKSILSIIKKLLKPLFRPYFKKSTENLQSPYNKSRQKI